MRTIKCQNCGVVVPFSNNLRCENCNIKLYGYHINTLPPVYKNIIDNGFQQSQAGEPVIGTSDEVTQIQGGEAFEKEANRLPATPGWLIVHTQGKEAIDFPLIEGINYIGRPVTDIEPHIQVPDDQYVSRGHAVLYVQKNPLGRFDYKLTDDSNNQRKAKSRNGTHVNGNEQRITEGEVIYLQDGDTIQIGITLLVLKTGDVVASVDEAKTQVQEMDYTRTIEKK